HQSSDKHFFKCFLTAARSAHGIEFSHLQTERSTVKTIISQSDSINIDFRQYHWIIDEKFLYLFRHFITLMPGVHCIQMFHIMSQSGSFYNIPVISGRSFQIEIRVHKNHFELPAEILLKKIT